MIIVKKVDLIQHKKSTLHNCCTKNLYFSGRKRFNLLQHTQSHCVCSSVSNKNSVWESLKLNEKRTFSLNFHVWFIGFKMNFYGQVKIINSCYKQKRSNYIHMNMLFCFFRIFIAERDFSSTCLRNCYVFG